MPKIKKALLTKQILDKTNQLITILDLSTIISLDEFEENYSQILEVIDEKLLETVRYPEELIISNEKKALIQRRLEYNKKLHLLSIGTRSMSEFIEFIKQKAGSRTILVRLDVNNIHEEVIEFGFSTEENVLYQKLIQYFEKGEISTRVQAQASVQRHYKGEISTRVQAQASVQRHYIVIPTKYINKLAAFAQTIENTPPLPAQRRSSAAMTISPKKMTDKNSPSPIQKTDDQQKQNAFSIIQERILERLRLKIDNELNPSFLYRSSDTLTKRTALTELRNALSEIPYDREKLTHIQKLNTTLNQYEKHPDIIAYRARGFAPTGKARMNNQLNGTEKLLQEIRKMINPSRDDSGANPKYNMREDIVHRLAHRIVELEASCTKLSWVQNDFMDEFRLITNKKNSLNKLLETIQELPQNTLAWTYREQIEKWEDKQSIVENFNNKNLVRKHNGFFQSWNSADNDLLDTLKRDLQVQANKNGQKKWLCIDNSPLNDPATEKIISNTTTATTHNINNTK